MNENWIRKNIECCACGGTLETSKSINVVETNKMATWKCPVIGYVDITDYEPRAVAVVCDDCMQNKKKIQQCIEYVPWEGSPHYVKYHEIESLKDVDKRAFQMKYYFGKKFRMEMLLKAAEIENKNGNLGKVELKGSENKIHTLNLPARCRQSKQAFRRTKEEKMKNPVYFRLLKEGHFVGFKRIVTEYLGIGDSNWQLDQIEHDPDETQKLSRPAMGIETLKRARISGR